MSDVPTSADNGMDLAAASAAGWSLHDIEWESKAERAAALAWKGELEAAAVIWHELTALARDAFPANDPRLGTSLANTAFALRARGGGGGAAARPLFDEARRIWDGSWHWVQQIKPDQRARSSMFHLRMEGRHRETYKAYARKQLEDRAEAARGVVVALAEGKPPPGDGLPRWRAEKPPIYGDSRKFLSACFLLVSVPAETGDVT